MTDGVYHQHLDVCTWCANHPFDLCPEGAKLILEEALGPQPVRETEPARAKIADVQYTAPEILCGATAYYAGSLVKCSKTKEEHRWHIGEVRWSCFPPTSRRVRWEAGSTDASLIE